MRRLWKALLVIGALALVSLGLRADARPLTPGWMRWVEDALEQGRLTSRLEVPHLYPIHLLPTESIIDLDTEDIPWVTWGNQGWLHPQLRIHSQRSPGLLPAITGAAAMGDTRIRLYGSFELAQRDPDDWSAKALHPWRQGIVLKIAHAGLWIEPLPRLALFVGRTLLQWGPGYHTALGVSGDAPPFDLVLLHYQLPLGQRVRVWNSLFATRLDPLWHQQPRRYLAQRYFMGHRLEMGLGSGLEIGVSEFVLYGGEAPSWEAMYFNPIMPYYVSQYHADRDDNILVTGDFWWRVSARVALYGELLVDDYQYARSESPNAMGFMGGLQWLDPYGNEWRFEYVRMNRWVYTHRIPEQQYTHFGVGIGYPLGPDAEEGWIRWQRWLARDAALQVSYSFLRKGEATPADRFRGGAYWLIPFPSGVVRRMHTFRIRGFREPSEGWQYGGEYRFEATRNVEHQPGRHETHHIWTAYLSYRISLNGG